MAKYTGTRLKTDILISKLCSVHYFEYPKNYMFSGEKHDFWEFIYVDKGELLFLVEEKEICLKQGSIVFLKPNEWHSISANSSNTFSAVVVSFECKSEAMKYFENKILTVGQEHKSIISKIIFEYTCAFSTPLDNPYSTSMIRKANSIIGSEQLIRQSIAELLILFLRQNPPAMQRTPINLNRENALLNMLVNYMIEHINETVTIEELVRYSRSNKTTIATVFKHSFNMSAIEYFISLKIDLAKQYIRDGNYNISQISEILGYSGIHYFSRQFKKVTGMSPTEYSASMQAMINKI